MEILDVTKIEPRLKHPTIFDMYDNLEQGSAMVIHNDHDPIPLYYQMIAEKGKTFDWEYILKGPEIFEVKITKLRTGETSSSIGELVAKDYRKAEIFRKFGLDFCCGGHKTVKEACEKKGVNYIEVENELLKVEQQQNDNTENFNEWELDFLADYIINKHHKYVSSAVVLLNELSSKVARVHGDVHPELIEIERNYVQVANELTAHMQKEEVVLFPYIKQMVQNKRNGNPFEKSSFGTIKNPIHMMESEHVSAGECMESIRTLSNNFTLPSDACNSYRVLFGKLEEFEKDLHQHIHLENNILFPKAIQMEKELMNQ